MLERMGTDATSYLDRVRYEIHTERGRQFESKKEILGSEPRGYDCDVDGGMLHLQNWVGCIRRRKEPSAPGEAGVAEDSGAHLAKLAIRTGKLAEMESAIV